MTVLWTVSAGAKPASFNEDPLLAASLFAAQVEGGVEPEVPVLDDVNRALTRVPSAPLLRHDGDRVCASRAYARRQEAPVGAG